MFRFLSYAFLGFLVQLMLVLVLSAIGLKDLATLPYMPWFWLGELLLPSTGPASHAMGGVGGMFFMLVSFVVYSFLLGLLIRKIRESYTEDRSNFLLP
ncbi:MAG TPA: hypothetical protein VMZ26_04370 [Pyrinomonadaceae bacterium]|nr:hypothetical protein [Pyrinomonadaceae bacterium]